MVFQEKYTKPSVCLKKIVSYMVIFISKVISFSWSSSFPRPPVCAKIDRRKKHTNNRFQEWLGEEEVAPVGLMLPIIERVRLGLWL